MTRELIDVVSSEALTEAGAFVACANSLFAGIAARDSEWTAPIARDEDEDEDFEIEDDGDDFGEEEEFGDEDAEEEKDPDPFFSFQNPRMVPSTMISIEAHTGR